VLLQRCRYSRYLRVGTAAFHDARGEPPNTIKIDPARFATR
jgi:hypothetical protein